MLKFSCVIFHYRVVFVNIWRIYVLWSPGNLQGYVIYKSIPHIIILAEITRAKNDNNGLFQNNIIIYHTNNGLLHNNIIMYHANNSLLQNNIIIYYTNKWLLQNNIIIYHTNNCLLHNNIIIYHTNNGYSKTNYIAIHVVVWQMIDKAPSCRFDFCLCPICTKLHATLMMLQTMSS